MDEEQRTGAESDGTLRYTSLRDYLRVVRHHRLLIAAITLLIGGGALVFSLVQEKQYKATSALSFRDPLQEVVLIGGTPSPELAPATRAQISTGLVTSPAVARMVKRSLKSDLSVDELTDLVEATVDLNTFLVAVTATSADPVLAADVSNAFAEASRKVETQATDRRLRVAEVTLQKQLKDALAAAKNLEASSFDVGTARAQLNQVRALQTLAEPVTIQRTASVPAQASAPRPARNTVLGLAIGLALGLIAAFARDVLDRRLRTAREAGDELGLPVLTRVPESAFGYAGLTKKDGLAMAAADFEAFRVLRTNLGYLHQDKSPRTVLVTSGMPEEGKSTVSMALASAAAVAGQRVLLVECDMRRPTFARRLGIPASPGLSDYLRGAAQPQDVVRSIELTAPWSPRGDGAQLPAAEAETVATLACVAAGSNAADAVELLESDPFREFVAAVSRAYDLVVFDGSPLLAVVDPLRIAAVVDSVLVCTRVNQSTREEAKAVRSALGNLPERPTGAVVTGLRRGGPDSYDYYYGY